MKNQNVAILFGGASPEYEVSLKSASSVIANIDTSLYTPILIGISRAGEWYHFTGNPDKIPNDTWCNETDCSTVVLSPNRDDRHILVFEEDGISRIRIDAVFPILHGKNGEDGTVQGLFELTGIPIVGCSTLSSALCVDKDRAHKIARSAGVDVPYSFVIGRDHDPTSTRRKAESLAFPLFVKPVRAGSSLGITKAASPDELLVAIEEAFNFDEYVIIEECIEGFEVGCAVLGNNELIVGEVDEIELSDGFFDFEEKYSLKTSKIHVPARIPHETAAEVKEVAQTIYTALGCKGFARVDMFITPSNDIVFNEVNTIPGFTAHSRFPAMLQATGLSFKQIISRAIELAFE